MQALRLLQFFRFLSTPSARRATSMQSYILQAIAISIHALREEGDPQYTVFVDGLPISIHALREEGDLGAVAITTGDDLFLSTPSARRATCRAASSQSVAVDFYPRPPRGGRLVQALRLLQFFRFLSTPSARRATAARPAQAACSGISIHALREEGDTRLVTAPGRPSDFYPRPPRGGRRLRMWSANIDSSFLSTPSARRATRCLPFHHGSLYNFYPRPPRGGRLVAVSLLKCSMPFLSTPSARRATHIHQPIHHKTQISIHALREEGDPSPRTRPVRWELFLSTPSARRATLL